MSVYIHHVETWVPETSYAQDVARDWMKQWVGTDRQRRLVQAIYDRSGIEKRHSVLHDFLPGREPELFRTDAQGRLEESGTEERNRVFARESKRASVEVARRLLRHAKGFSAGDITHVITVSCTGFYSPGPDYGIVQELGLSDATQRYNLGFMGCYAALPALRMATQFCEANPRAVVLVECLELCSLHMQVRDDEDSLLANALFSDGAAAVLVSSREPGPGSHAFRIGPFLSALAPSGRGDMAWEVGNRGFNIVLSSYVPDVIATNIMAILEPVLATAELDLKDVDVWAVHPGGKAIVDKVSRALALEPPQVQPSRDVLRDYGNMSSVTILFVLKSILDRAEPAGRVCAMAFGPGLTIEVNLLEHVTVPSGTPVAVKDIGRP